MAITSGWVHTARMDLLAIFLWILALLGLGQAVMGWVLLRRFGARAGVAPALRAPVSVLKPLCGDEPLLEVALESLCRQDFAPMQIVFGVQDSADPALAVVARLRARFPDRDIALVVDATAHGRNPKISNLINMLPVAQHDILVMADADMHVALDYLSRVVAALERPGVGLVTTLYTGLPARPGLVGELGASGINFGFLPSALIGRALGREDCLGATMALHRDVLARIGGLPALADHLADDNVLGQKVRGLGLGVALATTIPATTVAEATLAELARHELRWARTIRALEPAGFAASILQYKLIWAGLALLAAPDLSGLGFFAAILAGGALVAHGTGRSLGLHGKELAFARLLWLLPLRELMSVSIWVAAHAGTGVEWRGQRLHATPAREKL